MTPDLTPRGAPMPLSIPTVAEIDARLAEIKAEREALHYAEEKELKLWRKTAVKAAKPFTADESARAGTFHERNYPAAASDPATPPPPITDRDDVPEHEPDWKPESGDEPIIEPPARHRGRKGA